MKNWQKSRNYRKLENADGSFRFVITIDGEDVEASEAVYKAYSQADRRERYCAERDAGRFLSLDRMDEDEVLLSYLTDEHIESAEDTALRGLFEEQARAAFNCLEPDERRLIQALIIDGLTERDFAVSIGLSQKSVNKRKHKILEKLKRLVLKQ
jgi:RNA polymerase sigma factor (sigma-70 family)